MTHERLISASRARQSDHRVSMRSMMAGCSARGERGSNVCRFEGPKARMIPAWGNAPGFVGKTIKGLKARLIVSVPHVTFVELDPVFREKSPVFLLEGSRPMMFLLVVYVME